MVLVFISMFIHIHVDRFSYLNTQHVDYIQHRLYINNRYNIFIFKIGCIIHYLSDFRVRFSGLWQYITNYVRSRMWTSPFLAHRFYKSLVQLSRGDRILLVTMAQMPVKFGGDVYGLIMNRLDSLEFVQSIKVDSIDDENVHRQIWLCRFASLLIAVE